MTALIKPEIDTHIDEREIDSFARRLAVAFTEAVRAESDGRRRNIFAGPRDSLEQLVHASPDNISWHELGYAEDRESGAAAIIWQRIRQLAREELESGTRAADVMAEHLTPWIKAKLYELRASLIEQWQPKGSIETRMLEVMAQTYTAYELWMAISYQRSMAEYEADQLYDGVMLSVERSAAMAERFLRMFLRAVRSLRDLRRYSMPVTINNPQQVNIAADGGQQVNLQENPDVRMKT